MGRLAPSNMLIASSQLSFVTSSPADRQLWVGATYQAPGKDFFWDSGGQRVQVKVQGDVTRGATCAVLIMFRTAGHLAAQNCQLPRYFVCEKTLP